MPRRSTADEPTSDCERRVGRTYMETPKDQRTSRTSVQRPRGPRGPAKHRECLEKIRAATSVEGCHFPAGARNCILELLSGASLAALAGAHMLWTIFATLVVLWLLGIVSASTFGGFIHVLLALAIAVVLRRVIQGEQPMD